MIINLWCYFFVSGELDQRGRVLPINELFNQVFTRTVHKAIENYFYFTKMKIFHFPIVDNRFSGIGGIISHCLYTLQWIIHSIIFGPSVTVRNNQNKTK